MAASLTLNRHVGHVEAWLHEGARGVRPLPCPGCGYAWLALVCHERYHDIYGTERCPYCPRKRKR